MTEQNAVLDVQAALKSVMTDAQVEALAQKFAKQPKSIKRDVRGAESTFDEVTNYALYILRKAANDYIGSQMRDVWIQRLETLIPRLNTKDEKLKAQTEKQVAAIALEIEDVDQRAEIQTLLKRNLLPKSSDMLSLIACFERLAQLFESAWKA